MKATLIIHNGKVMASLTERPMSVGCSDNYDNIESFLSAQRKVKEWEDALLEVENVFQVGENQFRILITEMSLSPVINSNQQAEIERTETGCIVKSLSED